VRNAAMTEAKPWGNWPQLNKQLEQRLRRRAGELGLMTDRNIWVWKHKSERP
jgi:hypothetical protein